MNSERMTVERLAPELDKLLASERALRGPGRATAIRLSDRLALSLGEPALEVPVNGRRLLPALAVSTVGLALLAGVLWQAQRPLATQREELRAENTAPVFARIIITPAPRATAMSVAAHPPPAPKLRHPAQVASSAAEAPAADEADSLAREAELLEAARVSLAAQDFVGTSATLRSHEREFPQGQLAEERDVLQIRLSLARGDDRGASAQAQQFLDRYPNSALRSQIAPLIMESLQ